MSDTDYEDSPFGVEITVGRRIEDFLLESEGKLLKTASEEYKTINEDDIRLWLKQNGCAWADPLIMVLEQLANGDTTIEEFRNWVLETKNNFIGKVK